MEANKMIDDFNEISPADLSPEDELMHYVSYTRSASNMYETTEVLIPSRDINKIIFPTDCTSFELFDKVLRHQNDQTIFVGEIVNRSQYYIGKKYSLDDLIRKFGESADIVEICRDSGSNAAVKVYGNEFIALRDTDQVISPDRVKTSSTPTKSYMERY